MCLVRGCVRKKQLRFDLEVFDKLLFGDNKKFYYMGIIYILYVR